MNVLIAADKFKGSLDSYQVGKAIGHGIKRAIPTATIKSVVVSDGGDGFLAAIHAQQSSLEWRSLPTVDALQRPITASCLWDPEQQTGFVEMAQASGLHQIEPEARDLFAASSVGTGHLLDALLQAGARRIFVGLGGSASNDGGVGMAAACGYRFLNAGGQPFLPTGGTLQEIAAIDANLYPTEFHAVDWVAVNDVQNPLIGPRGAAAVFGPQKGALPSDVPRLENGLRHLQYCVIRDLGVEPIECAGDGAAGGAGFGLRAFFGARFESGVEFILTRTGLDCRFRENDVDFIVTGEGCLDDQTTDGKLVQGLAQLGRRNGVPVVAFCGVSDLTAAQKQDLGLSEIREIHDPGLRSTSESMDQAFRLLEQEAFRWASNLKS